MKHLSALEPDIKVMIKLDNFIVPTLCRFIYELMLTHAFSPQSVYLCPIPDLFLGDNNIYSFDQFFTRLRLRYILLRYDIKKPSKYSMSSMKG